MLPEYRNIHQCIWFIWHLTVPLHHSLHLIQLPVTYSYGPKTKCSLAFLAGQVTHKVLSIKSPNTIMRKLSRKPNLRLGFTVMKHMSGVLRYTTPWNTQAPNERHCRCLEAPVKQRSELSSWMKLCCFCWWFKLLTNPETLWEKNCKTGKISCIIAWPSMCLYPFLALCLWSCSLVGGSTSSLGTVEEKDCCLGSACTWP